MSAPPGARCSRHPEVGAHALCARCGDFVCGRCVAARTPDGVYCGACERAAGPPFVWERRDALGAARAWLATVVGVLTATRATFAPGFRDRSVVPAVGFGLLGSTPVRFLLTADELLWPSVHRASATSGPLGWLWSDEGVLASGLASPLTFVLGVLLLAGLWWLALRVVAPRARPLSHVVRAVAYVQGATAPLGLVALLPELGVPLELAAVALSFVLQGVALRTVTRVSAGRVAGAAALVLVTLGLLLVALALGGALARTTVL